MQSSFANSRSRRLSY